MKLPGILLVTLHLLACVNAAVASDLDKEQRWKEQIVDSLLDGDGVDLTTGDTEFFAIFTEADESADTSIVVIHGSGVHPNWDQVVYPLRVGLAEAGWNTLSIQMPVLANDATYEEYREVIPEAPERITAAIEYLVENGAKQVVLVSHSLGARMSNYFLAQLGDAAGDRSKLPIAGYVGIGMSDGNVELMRQFSLPMLDLYGSDDLPGVMESVEARAEAASGNPAYTQQRVEGANHFFDGKNSELLDAVKLAIEKFETM